MKEELSKNIRKTKKKKKTFSKNFHNLLINIFFESFGKFSTFKLNDEIL